MKLSRLTIALAGVFLLASNPSATYAQNAREQGIASLSEVGCITAEGEGKYEVVNRDIVVGKEVFRSVASLQDRWWRIINHSEPISVVCRLAPPNNSPQFKTLTLSFGLDQASEQIDSSVIVRFSIYKDGSFYGERTISKGDKQRWIIDVNGTRSLSLDAECVQPKQGSHCPSIYFFEDILRR